MPRILCGTIALAVLGLLSPGLGGAGTDPPEEEVRIVAERFFFTPSKLKVRSGARLKIVLESRDTFHGFRLEGSDIDVVIPARGRGSVEVSWVAPEPGRYDFVCSKRCGAGHAQMRGAIIVE